MPKSRFCKYVAKKRQEIGLTQKQLADALCYTPQAISRFESLDSAFPFALIPLLCKTLHCSIDDIYLRNEDTHYEELPFTLDELPSLLRKKREACNKTQEDIASYCHCTSKSIRNYESGAGSISYQFIETFCEYLSILPSELVKTKETPQNPDEIHPEVIQRNTWLKRILAIGGIAVALSIIIAILIPILSTAAKDSALFQSSVSTTSPKYGLEPSGDVPAFIQLKQSKHVFSYIGDTIELSIEDAYGDMDVSVIPDDMIEYRLIETSPTLSVTFTHAGNGKTIMTLESAQNGEGSRFNVIIGGTIFYQLGYFAYYDQTPVYLKDDINHEYPFSDAGIYHAGNKEATVYLQENNYLSYFIFYFDSNGGNAYVENPGYAIGWSCMQSPRIYEHIWHLDIHDGSNYVEVPKQIEVDDAFVIYYVEVQGMDDEPYWFMLTPLHLHIVH